MTKERKFKREYATELLKIARGDLEAAEVLNKGKVSRKENILFHVGQAIEKALKAYLCRKGEAVPMTHDLEVVIDRIANSAEIPHVDLLDDLTQFATIRRYEEGSAELTAKEISAALKACREIIKWVEGKS